MPLADFSLTFDPEIVDTFLVLRRTAAVDIHGRSQPQVVAVYRGIDDGAFGTVTIAGANDLRRLPEQEVQLKTISIVTPFGLQSARDGQQPDIVRWHGEDYVVVDLEDYSGFGPGFINALAQRLEANIPFGTQFTSPPSRPLPVRPHMAIARSIGGTETGATAGDDTAAGIESTGVPIMADASVALEVIVTPGFRITFDTFAVIEQRQSN